MFISMLYFHALLFLNILNSVHGTMHQSKLYRIHLNKNQRHRNLGNNFKTLPNLAERERSRNGTIFNYQDLVYYMNITCGSNLQKFLVIVDTGSPQFWVTDSSCTSSQCATKHRFHRDQSCSYRPTNLTFSVDYVTGASEGIYGIDTVGFGDPPLFMVPDCHIGQAAQIAYFFTLLPDCDGVMGLAPYPSEDSPPAAIDSPILTAFKQGQFKEQMFTIYLEADKKNTSLTPGGLVTWGDADNVNCDLNINYVPLVPKTVDPLWTIPFESLCYGNYCDTSITRAIVDSGTTAIVGGTSMFNLMLQMGVGANIDDDGVASIRCEREIEPLVLKIGSNQYSIPTEKLVVRGPQEGTCILKMQYVYEVTDFWVLGLPFCQEYCQIYDVGNKQLGFAHSKQRN